MHFVFESRKRGRSRSELGYSLFHEQSRCFGLWHNTDNVAGLDGFNGGRELGFGDIPDFLDNILRSLDRTGSHSVLKPRRYRISSIKTFNELIRTLNGRMAHPKYFSDYVSGFFRLRQVPILGTCGKLPILASFRTPSS